MMQTGEGGRGAEAGHGQVRGLAPLMSSPASQESWRHPPSPTPRPGLVLRRIPVGPDAEHWKRQWDELGTEAEGTRSNELGAGDPPLRALEAGSSLVLAVAPGWYPAQVPAPLRWCPAGPGI